MTSSGRAEEEEEGKASGKPSGIKPRHDGFTPAKRRRFLVVLGKTGCISDGARAAGISTTTVDRWRRKDPDFDAMCVTALAKAAAHIELLAWQRGVEGIDEPVYHYGKFSRMRRKRSDSIFRLIMMGSNGKKYGRMGAVGGKGVSKDQRQRIEDEVYRKIEDARPSREQLEESIMRKLEAQARRLVRDEGWILLPSGAAMEPEDAEFVRGLPTPPPGAQLAAPDKEGADDERESGSRLP